MNVRFYIIFIIIFMFYCFNNYGINFTNNRYIPADYVVMANQIRVDVATKLSERYNMRVIGITGGMADVLT